MNTAISELEKLPDSFPALTAHKQQIMNELKTVAYLKRTILIKEGQPLAYCPIPVT